MRKLALVGVLLLAAGLLVGCGKVVIIRKAPNPTVMMGASSFTATSITIAKGSSITFTDDLMMGSPHVLVLGQNGIPTDESGAPDFGGVGGHMFQAGQSWTTAPWNTPGTYYVTCTLHATTMTLTVIVTG